MEINQFNICVFLNYFIETQQVSFILTLCPVHYIFLVNQDGFPAVLFFFLAPNTELSMEICGVQGRVPR